MENPQKTDRSIKAKFVRWMEKNPVYYQGIWGTVSVDVAYEEAKDILKNLDATAVYLSAGFEGKKIIKD